jgi:hypothetical protein
MRNLKILMIGALMVGITACVDAQIRKTVHGNRNVVKKERSTGSFTGIKVSTGIDVFLKQTGNESIVVEADENLHEYIKTEIRDGVLNVYSDANMEAAKDCLCYNETSDLSNHKRRRWFVKIPVIDEIVIGKAP